MLELSALVFGAAFTLAACWCAGTFLTRRVELIAPLRFGIGAAAFSMAVFVLMLAGWAKRPGMAMIGVLALAGFRRVPLAVPRVPRPAWLALVPFGVVYLVQAMAPELHGDSNVYHLKPAVDALSTGGFPDTISFYDRLPQGLEMLFAHGYAFGGASSAKLVHLAFLALTLPLVVAVGMRLGVSERISWAAALMYFVTPVAGATSTVAFNDSGAVFYTLAAILLILDGMPLLGGIAAGACYWVKITGLLVPLLLALVFVKRRSWRQLAVFVCGAAFLIAPWMIRNAVELGNPAAPLLNRVFPNRYFYIYTEAQLSRTLGSWGLVPWFEAPIEITVRGRRFQGLLGPVFLLAPLALLRPRLAAIAVGLAIPWFFNMGTRFLMPALPFLALGMLAAVPWRLACLLVATHSIASLPPIVDEYAPGAFRVSGFPWRAALRIESESEYLQRESFDYRVAKMVEKNTIPGDRILDLHGMYLVHLSREVTGNWQSAAGNRLFRGLQLASLLDQGIFCDLRASFPERAVTAVRVIQTGSGEASWSVSEVELYRGDVRILPSRRWQLDAEPNVWDAPRAFDNNLTTAYNTWEAAKPGMLLEIDFGYTQLLSGINVVGLGVEDKVRVEIRTRDTDGNWTRHNALKTLRTALNLRKSATSAIRREGIRYIVAPVSPTGNGLIGESLVNHDGDWGVERVANYEQVHLLRIR